MHSSQNVSIQGANVINLLLVYGIFLKQKTMAMGILTHIMGIYKESTAG